MKVTHLLAASFVVTTSIAGHVTWTEADWPLAFFVKFKNKMVALADIPDLNYHQLAYGDPTRPPVEFTVFEGLIVTKNTSAPGFLGFMDQKVVFGPEVSGAYLNLDPQSRLSGLFYSCELPYFPLNVITYSDKDYNECFPTDVYLLPYDRETRSVKSSVLILQKREAETSNFTSVESSSISQMTFFPVESSSTISLTTFSPNDSISYTTFSQVESESISVTTFIGNPQPSSVEGTADIKEIMYMDNAAESEVYNFVSGVYDSSSAKVEYSGASSKFSASGHSLKHGSNSSTSALGMSEMSVGTSGISGFKVSTDGVMEKEDMEKGAMEKEDMEKGAMEKEAMENVAMEKGAMEKEAMEKGAMEKEAMEKGAMENVAMEKGAMENVAMEKGASKDTLNDAAGKEIMAGGSPVMTHTTMSTKRVTLTVNSCPEPECEPTLVTEWKTHTDYTTYCPEETTLTITKCEEVCTPTAMTVATATTLTISGICIIPETITVGPVPTTTQTGNPNNESKDAGKKEDEDNGKDAKNNGNDAENKNKESGSKVTSAPKNSPKPMAIILDSTSTQTLTGFKFTPRISSAFNGASKNGFGAGMIGLVALLL